jgi:hypothetical protein
MKPCERCKKLKVENRLMKESLCTFPKCKFLKELEAEIKRLKKEVITYRDHWD